MSIRDRVREWLFGDESRELRTLDKKIDVVMCVVELSHARLGSLLDKVEELLASVPRIEGSVQASRIAEKQHSAERANAIETLAQMLGTISEALERLLALLEPKAHRLRAGRPPIGDWDAVVQENLRNFEEPAK